MSWMNKQVPGQFRWSISSVAANAGQEVMLGATAANKIRIVSACFTPATAMVTDTDSGFALYLMNQGTVGTLGQTVASKVFTTAAATAAASVPISLTLASDADDQVLSASDVLTYKETTIGTGTARANGVLTVEYIIL